MADSLDPANYLTDSSGRLVHKSLVRDIDVLRTDLVNRLIDEAKRLQETMRAFRRLAYGDIEGFVALSAEQYKVTIGGKGGNITLMTFDGLRKVQVQVAKTLVFDERIKAAEALINQCLEEWTKGSRHELQALVQDAFRTDKAGELSTQRIITLRNIQIDDDRWRQAIAAINDSLQVAGSKSYVRFYERPDIEAKWQAISLDMASL